MSFCGCLLEEKKMLTPPNLMYVFILSVPGGQKHFGLVMSLLKFQFAEFAIILCKNF